jgi:hypothetical protein
VKIIDVIKTVENSEEYQTFIKNDPKNYLVHMFCMRDAHEAKDWQVGYYLKNSDKVTVFDYQEDKISILPAEEALKEKRHIPPLKIEDIKIDVDAAMDTVEDILKKNYSAESIVKAIVLLQNLPEYGQLWNITVITLTFHVINIKINAISGELIKHTKESLLGWNKDSA